MNARNDIEPVEPREDDHEPRTIQAEGVTITRKQFLFVQRFFEVEMDPVRAVVAAGYRTDNPKAKAEELMRNPYIAECIIRRMAQIQNATKLDADKVIAGLLKEAEAEGDNAQHSARVSAWGQLARILGLFDKGNQVDKNIVAINFDPDLDEDEEGEE